MSLEEERGPRRESIDCRQGARENHEKETDRESIVAEPSRDSLAFFIPKAFLISLRVTVKEFFLFSLR